MRTMERIYRYRMTTTSGGNLSIRDDDGDHLDHPGPGRQGEPPPRRHRPRPARRHGRGPAPALVGVPVPPGDLRGPARPPRRSSTPTRWRWWPSASAGGCPTPGCSPRPGRSAARSASPPTPCPGSEALGRNIAATFAAGLRLRRAGEPRRRDRRRRACRRRSSGSRRWSSPPRPSSRRACWATVRYLADEQADRPRPTALTPPQPPPGPATSREKELRRQLCEFVRRSYQQRLMISTQGAFSARLDADSFLITPAPGRPQHARRRTTSSWSAAASPEAGKTPSSRRGTTGRSTTAHPEIQADRQRLPGQRHGLQRHRRAARHPHDPRELHLPPRRRAASPTASSSATAASWPSWPRRATRS